MRDERIKDLEKWAMMEVDAVMNEFGDLKIQKTASMAAIIYQDILNKTDLPITTFLKRLLDGLPLTPIHNTPDAWVEIDNNGYEKYFQCVRRPSLFKKEPSLDDGDRYESFTDVDQFQFIDVDTASIFELNGYIDDLQKMFPITFPYFPNGPIKIFARRKITENADLIHISYVKNEAGIVIEINKFYKKKLIISGVYTYVEITKDEFLKG